MLCSRCGETLVRKGDVYVCPFCGAVYEDDSADKAQEMLRSILEEDKMERLANNRRLLWSATHEKYPSKDKVLFAARGVLSIYAEDFLAGVYLHSHDRDPYALNRLLSSSSVSLAEAQEAFRWLLPSLSPRMVGSLHDFVDRHFKNEERKTLVNELEAEAAKVSAGLYEPSLHREVFLCYSSADMPRVIQTMDLLEQNGFSCFAAFRNLRHGKGAQEDYLSSIFQAMRSCEVLVFLSSTASRKVDCEALKVELPYLIDQLPEKPRVEFLLEDYDDVPYMAKKTLKKAFPSQEYCQHEEDLLERVAEFVELAGKHKTKKEEELERALEEERKKHELELEQAKKQAALQKALEEEKKRHELELEQLKKEAELKKALEEEKRRFEEGLAAEKAKKEAELQASLEEERKRHQEELERAKKQAQEKSAPLSSGASLDEEAFLKMMEKAERLKAEKAEKEKQEKQREEDERRRLEAIRRQQEAERKKAEEEAERRRKEEEARLEAERKRKEEAERQRQEEERRRKEEKQRQLALQAKEKAEKEAKERLHKELLSKIEESKTPYLGEDGLVYFGRYPQSRVYDHPEVLEKFAPRKGEEGKEPIRVEFEGEEYVIRNGLLFLVEPIAWRAVYINDDNQALLISDEIIEQKKMVEGKSAYFEAFSDTSLHAWLNGGFAEEAFRGSSAIVKEDVDCGLLSLHGVSVPPMEILESADYGFPNNESRKVEGIYTDFVRDLQGATEGYWTSSFYNKYGSVMRVVGYSGTYSFLEASKAGMVRPCVVVSLKGKDAKALQEKLTPARNVIEMKKKASERRELAEEFEKSFRKPVLGPTLQSEYCPLKTLKYGKYPQSKVTDQALVDYLKTHARRGENGYLECDGLEYALYRDSYFLVEPIEWIVLREDMVEKGSVWWLWSKKCLDCQTLSGKQEGDVSDLTTFPIWKWLDEEFAGRAFPEDNFLVPTVIAVTGGLIKKHHKHWASLPSSEWSVIKKKSEIAKAEKTDYAAALSRNDEKASYWTNTRLTYGSFFSVNPKTGEVDYTLSAYEDLVRPMIQIDYQAVLKAKK